jgi:hypothetical protein
MQHWLSRSLRGENRSAAVQREKHASPRLLQSSHGKGSEAGGLSSGTVGLLPVLISCRLLYIIRVLPLQSVFSSPFTANPSIRSFSSLSIIRLPLTPATTGQPSVEQSIAETGYSHLINMAALTLQRAAILLSLGKSLNYLKRLPMGPH